VDEGLTSGRIQNMVSQRWQPPLRARNFVPHFEQNVPFFAMLWGRRNEVSLSITEILRSFLRDFIHPLQF
jgi:hypothetical protein